MPKKRTKQDKAIEEKYGVDLSMDDKRVSTFTRRIWEGGVKPGAYGYILVQLSYDRDDVEIRKITSHQRKCIMAYYIKTHDGEEIPIKFFAAKLGSKVRTIQYELKDLEEKGFIKSEPAFLENGSHGPNRYYFTHDLEDEFFDAKPTLTKVYGPANSLGLRNWHWKDYKDIPFQENATHTQRDKVENYNELQARKEMQKKRQDKLINDAKAPMARRKPEKPKKSEK